MVNNFKSKYLKKSKFPYFISEIGINHNGKLSLAIEMIKQSKKAGFDAVKFQKRDARDLLNFNLTTKKPIGYLSKSKFDIPKKTVKFGKWVYPDIRLELTKNDYKKIVHHYKKLNLPISIKKIFSKQNPKKILSFMKKDKKNNNTNINLVLLNKIGNVNYNCQFKYSKINRFLKTELVN